MKERHVKVGAGNRCAGYMSTSRLLPTEPQGLGFRVGAVVTGSGGRDRVRDPASRQYF